MPRLPCALCLIAPGAFRAESVEGWPGMPLCRAHVIRCGGTIDDDATQPSELNRTLAHIDEIWTAVFPPPPRARFQVIEGGLSHSEQKANA